MRRSGWMWSSVMRDNVAFGCEVGVVSVAFVDGGAVGEGGFPGAGMYFAVGGGGRVDDGGGAGGSDEVVAGESRVVVSDGALAWKNDRIED